MSDTVQPDPAPGHFPEDTGLMLVPGELQHRQRDWPGSGKFGGCADLQGHLGQRKGNQATSAAPAPANLPNPRPFKGLK